MHRLYWALLCLSPAFILSYSVYSLGVDYDLVFLVLALALLYLRNFVPSKSKWFLVLAIALFTIAIYRFSFAVFSLPFFIYGCLALGHEKSTVPASDVLLSRLACIIFVGLSVWSLFFELDWPQFQFVLFQKTEIFYLGFFFLSLLAFLPLFLIRLRKLDSVFYGLGLLSIFCLVGFGADWGYCLTIFCTLLFTSLIFNLRSVIFRPHIGQISVFTVILYSLLWNIPTPFIGMPGLGLYGVLYEAYPRLAMEDPLKHPFWREAAERYDNVGVGIYRNGMPPDTSKLEFLLRRTGVKNIQLLTAPNAGVVSQPPNFQTFYVLDDWSFSPSLRLSPDVSVDLLARIDGYLVYAPGWKVCKTCREIAKDLQIASIPAEVNLNKAILFSKGGEGVELLGGGWSQPEIWGVWSDGGLATIFIPKPEKVAKKLRIDLRAFISPVNPSQNIAISVNDRFSREYSLDKAEGNLLTLELPASTDNFYKIIFQIQAPVRPFDLGFNKDKRLLGIGLISAKFE
jgi:hypothetical protein